MPLRRRRSGRDARGSALILVPAGFLVLMLLAAIAVDSAATYLAQHQLSDAVAAAANDAASAGLSDRAFYSGGALEIDPHQAAVIVCQTIAAQADGGLHDIVVEMAVAGAGIAVRATANVNAVFGRINPGFAHHQVRAQAAAVGTGAPGFSPPDLSDYLPISC